jgi:signal peptidase I, bacterial type
MDFDFNLILVPATVIFFLIWLLDKFVWKQRQTKGKGNENVVIAWAYDFWPILAIVLVMRSFLYEPFNIPSDSMVPTLETGDFIVVNKYQYGVRLPIINKKIIDVGEPERGDVIVFRYPPQPTISYIKRVVGLPGDHIIYDHGQLSVNGQKVAKVPVNLAVKKINSIHLHRFIIKKPWVSIRLPCVSLKASMLRAKHHLSTMLKMVNIQQKMVYIGKLRFLKVTISRWGIIAIKVRTVVFGALCLKKTSLDVLFTSGCIRNLV